MKHIWPLIFLGSLGICLHSMEKNVFIPAIYHVDKEGLNDIVQNEILKRIDQEKIKKGVKKYVRAHHPGCSKEEEREYIQKIKEQAIANKVKKSILSHVRQNLYVTSMEKDRGAVLDESTRWQAVIDQINFGILVFDGQGKLVFADEKNKDKR